MGDQRNDSNETQHVSGDRDPGRVENAATPLDQEQPTSVTPERYPSVRQDDSIEAPAEGRSFDPSVDAPTPRQGAGDTSPAVNQGRLGPEADPAEGKRD
jgi:hypothetical protein